VYTGPQETAFFRVQASYADGTKSAWSQPRQATSDDEGIDPDGITPVTVSATALSNASVQLDYSGYAPPGETGPIFTYAGVAYAPYDAPNGSGQNLDLPPTDQSSGTATITGLEPGVKYQFVVYVSWQANSPGGGLLDAGSGFGDAAAETTGSSQTVPAAPAAATGVLDPTDPEQVDIHWTNSSDNEDQFKVLRSIGGAGFVQIADATGDATTMTDQLPLNFVAGEALDYEVEAANQSGTSGPATTQPSTKPVVTPYAFKNSALVQITYKGPGKPQFFQTVQITGNQVTTAMRQYEANDPVNGHGGKDPFSGPVPDNHAGNPNQPYGSVMPGGAGKWILSDRPGFPVPPYPTDFVGDKSFVTTVKNAAGQTIATIHWHTHRAKDGTAVSHIDSQQ
jgi:hypothetical protein